METHGPDPTHWNDGTPMTDSQRKKRAAFLRHKAQQQMRQQTGGQEKWNVAVEDGGAEVVMLDSVTEADGGV